MAVLREEMPDAAAGPPQPLALAKDIRYQSSRDCVHGASDPKLFSFVEELAHPLKQVALTVYRARGKLVNDLSSQVVFVTKAAASMPSRAAIVVTNEKIHRLLAEEQDPEALTAVVCGFGSALSLGCVGSVVGTAIGCPLGTAVGAVPALFTFGLSLPIGAMVGGAGGLGVGACTGGGAGFAVGATTGYFVAMYRVQLRNTYVYVAAKCDYGYDKIVREPTLKIARIPKAIGDTAGASGKKAKEIALNRKTHCAVAGAAAGAVSLGTAGAACGTVAGGITGAAVGVVPALFTFGLSIPIGAVLGAGGGLCTGAALGTSAGALGGGAAGFMGYKYSDAPGAAVGFVRRGVSAGGKGVLKACAHAARMVPGAPRGTPGVEDDPVLVGGDGA